MDICCLVEKDLVPGKDFSIIGFDCTASVCFPRFTSISQPTAKMGAIFANLLLERIANPRLKPRTVRLSAQLFPGETTGPAPRLSRTLCLRPEAGFLSVWTSASMESR